MMSLDSSTKKDNSFSAIIQARMGASRLPDKVLMDLGGIPIIEHIVGRIKKCHPEKIILAIPIGSNDDPLADWADKNSIDCVRGSEMNVLSRFDKAIELCETDIFIRVTGDNPFVEPEIALKTVKHLASEKAEFCVMEGSPPGTTVEAFTRDAFDKILKLASLQEEFEHVTLAVWYHPAQFNIRIIDAPSDLRYDNLRLTIDTQKDYELACLIHNALASENKTPSLREIIGYVQHNPSVVNINQGVKQQLSAQIKKKKSQVILSNI